MHTEAEVEIWRSSNCLLFSLSGKWSFWCILTRKVGKIWFISEWHLTLGYWILLLILSAKDALGWTLNFSKIDLLCKHLHWSFTVIDSFAWGLIDDITLIIKKFSLNGLLILWLHVICYDLILSESTSTWNVLGMNKGFGLYKVTHNHLLWFLINLSQWLPKQLWPFPILCVCVFVCACIYIYIYI